jgi:hypothetical protein
VPKAEVNPEKYNAGLLPMGLKGRHAGVVVKKAT